MLFRFVLNNDSNIILIKTKSKLTDKNLYPLDLSFK